MDRAIQDPQTLGPRAETDRKDSIMLAERLVAGELVSIGTPGDAD